MCKECIRKLPVKSWQLDFQSWLAPGKSRFQALLDICLLKFILIYGNIQTIPPKERV